MSLLARVKSVQGPLSDVYWVGPDPGFRRTLLSPETEGCSYFAPMPHVVLLHIGHRTNRCAHLNIRQLVHCHSICRHQLIDVSLSVFLDRAPIPDRPDGGHEPIQLVQDAQTGSRHYLPVSHLASLYPEVRRIPLLRDLISRSCRPDRIRIYPLILRDVVWVVEPVVVRLKLPDSRIRKADVSTPALGILP